MQDIRHLPVTAAHKLRTEKTKELLLKILAEVNRSEKAAVDWGQVGSLGHVLEELEGIASFLGLQK